MTRIKRWIGQFFLWITGWKLKGEVSAHKKYVLIAAPHTSNWDLVFMLAFAYVCELKVSWLGKHTLFRWPFGVFMRWLGGLPIDRRAHHNTVEHVADLFRERESLILAIPAEGTRKYRDYWKSGFYYIALEANVPIVLGFLDYKNKCGGFGPAIVPSGDVHQDMDRIREFYKDITGRHPENKGRIRLQVEDDPAATTEFSEKKEGNK